MPRVYHNGAVGTALPMTGPDPAARTVLRHPIDPLCCGPVDAGLYVTITIMLTREGL